MTTGRLRRIQPCSRAFAIGWLTVAAVAAVVVPVVIGASTPVITLVWLAIPALVLRRTGTPAALGLVRVPVGEFIRVAVSGRPSP